MKLYDNPLFHIIHIGKVIEQKLIRQMHLHNDITHADAKLLIVLGYNPEVTQKALADALSVSPPAISRHIDKLEKKDWLQRVANPESRREMSVRLTQKGEKQRNKVLLEFEQTLQNLLEELSSIKKTTLRDLVALSEVLEKNDSIAQKIREGISKHN